MEDVIIIDSIENVADPSAGTVPVNGSGDGSGGNLGTESTPIQPPVSDTIGQQTEIIVIDGNQTEPATESNGAASPEDHINLQKSELPGETAVAESEEDVISGDVILSPDVGAETLPLSELTVDYSGYCQAIVESMAVSHQVESERFELLMSEVADLKQRQDVANNNAQLLLTGVLLSVGLVLGLLVAKTLGEFFK